MRGHSGIVDIFLIRNAKTDTLNMGGDSLIHMAAQFGKYDIVMKVRVCCVSSRRTIPWCSGTEDSP